MKYFAFCAECQRSENKKLPECKIESIVGTHEQKIQRWCAKTAEARCKSGVEGESHRSNFDSAVIAHRRTSQNCAKTKIIANKKAKAK